MIFMLSLTASAQGIADRITAPVDESRRVTLTGNVYPEARAEFDRGPAPDGLPMDRMLLLLQPSPEQNTALESLLAQQLDPSSANYHAWLSPKQFGEQFGVSASDVNKAIQWLSSHGFAIGEVSDSRTVIEFSGNASQVRQAFHTEIHKYVVNGQEHWANASNPEIPAALAPVVAGVVSLNDFGPRANHTTFGPVRKAANTSEVKPLFDLPYNGATYYGFSPYDFATMYNITPLWNAGITGAGQIIAIPGQSDIKAADVASFRKAFGLPVNAPQIIVNGTDPGTIAGDEEESDLDVEWSGAVAKSATIKFVTSASTSTTSGVALSAEYIVDKKIASILSMSYGECEEGLGTTGNQFWNSLWQQAASEGITVFVAAGDSGSAGCDPHGEPAPSAAQYGLAVNGLASTPNDVAVGGTDLADYNPVGGTNTFSTYWATSNNSTTGASLEKYVPEVVWNDSCTILNEAACNNSANTSFVVIAGGSGGKSSCTVVNATTGACSGGYAKPSWQTGTGVPADGKRDIPDVSLFAGDGARGSFFLICDSTATPDGTCNYANSTDAISLAVGGTSGSSPAMAGIQALINQKENAAQGNINAKLYSLAAKETLSGCNSTNGSGSACVFNDVTAGTNAMPCLSGTTDCKASTAGDTYAILPGYNAGAGFDLASGLGTINANNLVTQWAGTVGAPKVTLSATSVAFGNQGKGTTSAAKTVTLTNSGTAALTGVSVTLGGTNPTDFAESNNCAASIAVNASCTITLEFKPTSTAAYSAAVSIKDNATGSPQSISLTGTGVTPSPAVTLSATSVAFGDVPKGTTSAAKTVTLKNSGTGVLSSLAITLAGTNPTDFVETNNCGTSVAAGVSCTITLEFKPTSTAAYTATVSIKDNATGSPQSIALTGTGVAPVPAVTLSASSVAFGDVPKGTTSATKTVTLKNSGTGALSSLAITLAGTNPTDFVETNNCGTSVAAGASCIITLEFKPAANAAYTAAVSIKDNATGSPQMIALSGTGITPAPAVTLSATSVAFGSVAKGTTSATKTVTLKNSGTGALSSLAITLAGTDPADFSQSNNCGTSVAVGATCTITLEFKPAAVASYTATLSIKDNAAGSPQSIALSGTGTTPAPTASLSAASVAFGSQVLGTSSAAKTVTLTNKGNVSLTGVAIALGGSNPTDFAETNNCASSLAVNASCTITLVFKPAAAAAYTATVSIKDDATGSPQTIALSGTGIKSTLTGTIIDYAGDGISGYGGDNGAAAKAHIYYGQGTAADANGNLYIADEGNNVVRKVNASTGIITTYAGNGYGAGTNPGGYSGDGGPATKAELGGPFGVALDKAGNLYIADTYNSAIRKVSATTGIITTVAGNGTYGYSGDGGPATQAEISWAKGVAVDTAGNLYISDTSNQVIRKVTAATGKISTIAGAGGGCSAETDAYGDGCPAIDANFEVPGYGTGTGGIAVDAKGNVFIADPDVETVREIQASNGVIKVVAGNGYIAASGAGGYSGDGGPATSAELNLPRDVKVDGAGNIFIADADNNVIREVSAATGKISTIAGIYYASGGGKELDPATSATGVKFATPAYISIDPSGNLFVSDVNNYEVDKVYGAAAATPVN